MATRKLPAFALIASVSDDADAPPGTPSIQMFYAAPNPITPGAVAVLFWDVPVAPKVRILAQDYDSGILINDGTGYLTVDPGPTATKVFTLQALDASGNVLVVSGEQLISAVTVAVS